jgi:hemoglobin
LYDRVGGETWFVALIERFYRLVEDDAVLRPLYPGDLDEPRRHLTEFLVQRFGGPEKYTATRGHPRLRMRHAPFSIGQRERDAWMANMTEALRASGLEAADHEAMLRYFEDAANMLVNA